MDIITSVFGNGLNKNCPTTGQFEWKSDIVNKASTQKSAEFIDNIKNRETSDIRLNGGKILGEPIGKRDAQYYSNEIISNHCDLDSCWIVINNCVYDITNFIKQHPGGEELLLEHGGLDASSAFHDVGHSKDASELLGQYFIGYVQGQQNVERIENGQNRSLSAPVINIKENNAIICKQIMVYVSGGQMVDSKSPWRLSIIPELFWGIINFVVLFFQTMINPSKTSKGSDYTTDYRVRRDDHGGGGAGGPQRRMGGFRHGAGGASPPPMAGGG